MKTLLLCTPALLLLGVLVALPQGRSEQSRYVVTAEPRSRLGVIHNTALIRLVGMNKDKYFDLNISGDSIVSSGTLTPDSAARAMFDHLSRYWKTEMTALRDSLNQLRKVAK